MTQPGSAHSHGGDRSPGNTGLRPSSTGWGLGTGTTHQ